jgi:hypothetical protein
MRIAMSILVALILSACATATTPVSHEKAQPVPRERLLAFQEPTAAGSSIVVTRDTGLLGSGCFYAFLINGKLAARFNPAETATFYVEPGELLLRSARDPEGKGLCALGQDQWTQRETLLRADERKYFRLSIGADGKTDIQRTE